MKKFIFSSFLLSTITCFVFTGCKKDDNGSGGSGGTSKSTTDMLTGGSTRKWKQVSELHNGSPITQDPCDQDDRYIFTKSGNVFTLDYGTTHCDSAEANNLTGTWALSNNDKSLTLNASYMGTPVTESLQIVSISDSQIITMEIDQNDTITSTLNVAN